MKTYKLFTFAGLLPMDGPTLIVTAPDWQQARKHGRAYCRKEKLSFATVWVLKPMKEAPLFETPKKVKNLSKFVGEIVVFTHYTEAGKWNGVNQGILIAVSKNDLTPTVQTVRGLYYPNPKHVQTTGQKPVTA